jgi:hypothetical protein
MICAGHHTVFWTLRPARVSGQASGSDQRPKAFILSNMPGPGMRKIAVFCLQDDMRRKGTPAGGSGRRRLLALRSASKPLCRNSIGKGNNRKITVRSSPYIVILAIFFRCCTSGQTVLTVVPFSFTEPVSFDNANTFKEYDMD